LGLKLGLPGVKIAIIVARLHILGVWLLARYPVTKESTSLT